MKLLVVEDDHLLNSTLCYNLIMTGYVVDSALTKADAISLCEKQDYDLIILDINLPDGNGFDFCREIKERCVDTAVISNSGIDTGTVFSFSPFIYIGTIVFSLLTAWLGAITPAKKAASISPMEALHYIGEYASNKKVKYAMKGKMYRMALRNIFRDKRRAAIVMLSLFLSITVFTSVMMVVNSINIDNYINSEYDYDFFFTSDMTKSYFLNEDFVEKVQKNAGVKTTSVTRIGSVELRALESLSTYAEWIAKETGVAVDTVVMEESFFNTHTIKGIDMVRFDELNATISVPIDRESFERGEVAMINVTKEELLNCFDDVTNLEIKRGADDEYKSLTVGGIVNISSTQADTSFQYSDMEILVSNEFLEQYMEQPKILSLGINAESKYEEQLYHTFKEFLAEEGISMTSRYEGRKAMQDAKIIMLVLGGGISFILGFIGIFNFINVMSVGVMTRRHEFATLESIGMSKKQLRSMLRYEGIGYAVITLFFAASAGNLMGYGIFRIFQNIVNYAIYDYPFTPVFAVYVVIILICLVTPELAYRSISKNTLVERLRK